MITNNNDITNYTNYNKIYIPEQYVNQNYNYRINGDSYILIITNNNCYTNYNTTYCDCYNYNYKENIVSNAISCNVNNNNNYTISYEQISTDINYSDRIINYFNASKSLILGIFIVGIIFAILLTKESRY